MRTCEFCGSELPEDASFCGICGRAPRERSETPTRGGLPVITPQNANTPPNISRPGISNPGQIDAYPPQGQVGHDSPTSLSNPGSMNFPPRNSGHYNVQNQASWPGNSNPNVVPSYPPAGYQSPSGFTPPQNPNEEDEEERRRKAALLGFGMLGGMVEAPGMGGNAPMVQGTPQLGNVPMIHGTPQAPGNVFGQGAMGSYSGPTFQGPSAPNSPYSPPSPGPGPGPHPGSPTPPTGAGCVPIWFLIVIIPILIIATIIGAGFTIFAPNISLSGSGVVIPGGTFHLHGSSFLPGSSVTLTIDDSIPLYFAHQGAVAHTQYGAHPALNAAFFGGQLAHIPNASNVVKASGNGVFDVTIPVGNDWKAGQHTIHAAEGGISPRNASLTITVNEPGTTTVTPTLSPTPSVSPVDLCGVNPDAVSFGPVSEGYTQKFQKLVSLCATGNGSIDWTANWDQNQFSWLQVTPKSGQIASPGVQQIQLEVAATTLKAGNYVAQVTFSSKQSDKKALLNISFTIQAGCLNVQPASIDFSGVAGVSDPQSQTITLNNCGSIGNWTSTITTDNKINWLSISPTAGSIDANGNQSVTISASNLTTQLAAGTYTGQVVFSIGTQQYPVAVKFVVQAAPQLVLYTPSNNPPSINGTTDCTYSQSATGVFYICYASIGNSSKTQSLSWTSSSTGIQGITFSPSSGTLKAGQTLRVKISVPYSTSSCSTATTLTFTGPANSLNIGWTCTIIG